MTQFNFIPGGIAIEIIKFIFAGTDESAGLAWRALKDRLILDHLPPSTKTLLPLVYWQIERVGIPTDLRHQLRHLYLKTWETNEILISRFQTVKTAFQEHDIPFIPLKGYALAFEYYPDRAARPMGDIDILVRPADHQNAAQLLEGLGFKMSEQFPDIVKQGMHAVNYVKDDGFEAIDLHSQIIHGGNTSHVTDFVWESIVPKLVNGKYEYQLSQAELLFNVLAHGLLALPTFPVRWIPDALFIGRKDPKRMNWDRFHWLAIVSRRGFLFSQQLEFLDREFGFSFPKEIQMDLNRQSVGRIERISYSFITKRSERPIIRSLQLYYRQVFFGINNLPRRDLLSAVKFVAWHLATKLRNKANQTLYGPKAKFTL